MKRFLLKVFLFFVIIFCLLTSILVFQDSYIDHFYKKFTSGKQKSFLIGDSRAMVDLVPGIIEKHFQNQLFEFPVYNYAFTVMQSRYSPLYLRSLMKKFDTSSKKGLFILSVHPWSLSTPKVDYKKEENGVFGEINSPPHNMQYVDVNPNFEYILRNTEFLKMKGLISRNVVLHDDGWLENLISNSNDSVAVENSKNNSIIPIYKYFSKEWCHSEIRINSLIETIKYFDQYGTVVMVQLPVSMELTEIENLYWIDFDNRMESISRLYNVPFINMRGMYNFKTFDGLHLDVKNAKLATSYMCEAIDSLLQEKLLDR